MVKTQVLSEEFYVSCFASGLCEELQNEVLLFEPTTLVQAISLARMQEQTVNAIVSREKHLLRQSSHGAMPQLYSIYPKQH